MIITVQLQKIKVNINSKVAEIIKMLVFMGFIPSIYLLGRLITSL